MSYTVPVPFVDYVNHGVITASPNSALTGPGRINVFKVSTASGNVAISPAAPATLGIRVGDILVFRKTTTDTNKVTWTGDLEGTSGTLSLVAHYKEDLAQISLLCVSLTGTYYVLFNL